MRPIIFLDIDGVLNSARYLREVHAKDPKLLQKRENHIDPQALERLNRILLQTNAEIVISSCWRVGAALGELRSFFMVLGLHNAFEVIIGKTPATRWNEPRGHEISRWLFENHRVGDPFVILDDDSDMEPLMDDLVQTDYETGLTDEHIEEVIRRLV